MDLLQLSISKGWGHLAVMGGRCHRNLLLPWLVAALRGITPA